MEDQTCDECNEPFTENEWDDRHTPATLVTHAGCCFECDE